MDNPNAAQTKSTRVYGELRRDITAGTFRPGEHLVRRDLVKRYGVSLSIINEALGRLSGDGLVETTEMIGTRVISLTEEKLRDEFALREAIERHVVRLLAERGSDELLRSLLDDARTLDRWMNELGHDEGQGSLLHLEFHLKLARSSGYVSLEESLKRTSMRALLTTRWLKNLRLPHPVDFHQQLIRAILKRDPVAADQAMREHLHYADKFPATESPAAAEPAQRADFATSTPSP
ncbi:MAG: GntR family transcriptional regulator [Opitutus sp.]|nr:GntR family transcriptional regulator [Opitutus sp.]